MDGKKEDEFLVLGRHEMASTLMSRLGTETSDVHHHLHSTPASSAKSNSILIAFSIVQILERVVATPKTTKARVFAALETTDSRCSPTVAARDFP